MLDRFPFMTHLESRVHSAISTSRRAFAGELPDRYGELWKDPFNAAVADWLTPSVRILDVGSGSEPTLPIGYRPTDCEYVGLDLSVEELHHAPKGSYDQMIEADVSDRVPELVGRFDIVLSWHVLEHVRSLTAAFDNMHDYLIPGGSMAVHFSGAFSIHSVGNRLLPERFGRQLLERLLSRSPETVFPAFYDQCWASAIKNILRNWSHVTVVPHFVAGNYLAFAPRLRALYLGFEDFAVTGGHANLASHYLVIARR